MQITILFVPLHSLNEGKHIGELAEWSNAAVLKTVDLNGSGGSNPSLSANEQRKWRQVYLNAIFFAHLLRPAAGGEGYFFILSSMVGADSLYLNLRIFWVAVFSKGSFITSMELT